MHASWSEKEKSVSIVHEGTKISTSKFILDGKMGNSPGKGQRYSSTSLQALTMLKAVEFHLQNYTVVGISIQFPCIEPFQRCLQASLWHLLWVSSSPLGLKGCGNLYPASV